MKNKKKLIGSIILISCLMVGIGLLIYGITCVSGWENVDVVNMGSVDVCEELGMEKLIRVFGTWGLIGFLIIILIIGLIGIGLLSKGDKK